VRGTIDLRSSATRLFVCLSVCRMHHYLLLESKKKPSRGAQVYKGPIHTTTSSCLKRVPILRAKPPSYKTAARSRLWPRRNADCTVCVKHDRARRDKTLRAEDAKCMTCN